MTAPVLFLDIRETVCFLISHRSLSLCPLCVMFSVCYNFLGDCWDGMMECEYFGLDMEKKCNSLCFYCSRERGGEVSASVNPVRFGPKVGQISPKWDKSGFFLDLSEPKHTEISLIKSRFCPIWGQCDPVWAQILSS